MSDDDFYDDDFHSETETRSPRRSPSPRGGTSGGTLLPIVEVPTPSETNTDIGSPRNDDSQLNTERSDDIESEETEEEHETSERTPRRGKSHQKKTKNGRFQIDMTPPDKLLKRAEKKSVRYAEKKKVDSALKELIRCTALSRIVYGDGHWKLARSYVNLAKGYFELKGYAPQALQHADFAKSIMLSGVQMSESSTDKPAIMAVLVDIYYTLARAYTVLKKYPDAEQSINKADKLAKERHKLPSIKDDEVEDWRIKIYLAMARLGSRQHKYAVATTNFEKALDLMEVKHGRDGVELIPIYQSLGKVEQSKGSQADHEKAIEHYLQAHSIASAKYKDNSVQVAETASALASAYSNIRDIEAETSAESYLNECLGIYQVVYGPLHEKTIETEDDLARLMIRSDRQDEGLNMLKNGVNSKKEVYGDISPEVVDTWKLMANVYLTKGDSEKALRALKKCINLESTLYGKNHKKTKDTQRTMDLLLANPNLASKQKKTKAEELNDRPRFNSVVSRSRPVGAGRISDD